MNVRGSGYKQFFSKFIKGRSMDSGLLSNVNEKDSLLKGNMN